MLEKELLRDLFRAPLTDPQNHDSDNFVYIVRGIDASSMDMNGCNESDVFLKIAAMRDPAKFYQASLIARLQPVMAIEKLSWHGGSIDHTTTFGNVGLIFDPGFDGLVKIAWNCDLGSPTTDERLQQFVQQHGGKIKYPLGLLTQPMEDPLTHWTYNELIVQGNDKLQIKGVFYREGRDCEKEGCHVQAVLTSMLGKNIPLVCLPMLKSCDEDWVGSDEDKAQRRLLMSLRRDSAQAMLAAEFQNPARFLKPHIIKNYGGFREYIPSVDKYENEIKVEDFIKYAKTIS